MDPNEIQNIEIKARSKNLPWVKQQLEKSNARYIGADHQVDTYFICPHGRLKLREGNIENHLIFYTKDDLICPSIY